MINVVCLNWNNYLGRGALYVDRLRTMVNRNLTIPYKFIVITERDLPAQRTGWFNKLWLPGMFTGDVLYLDLDVVITKNIDHLVSLAQCDRRRVWMRDDFSYSIVNPRTDLDDEFKRYLGGPGTCNSSVMLWSGRKTIKFSDEFLAQVHGDQNALTALLWPDRIGLLPNDSIKSFKYHPGEVAPIMVFHGAPKMHEVCESWVDEHWR